MYAFVVLKSHIKFWATCCCQQRVVNKLETLANTTIDALRTTAIVENSNQTTTIDTIEV